MIEIRTATQADKAFWFRLDGHLAEAGFDRKVRDGQAYVLLVDGAPAGILRYCLFWDNTPFCNLLVIDAPFRRAGLGRRLMERWERDMRDEGFDMLMTSTQVDEDAQHFYRKLGYRDCGGLVIDIPGHEQPMELFLLKGIRG